MDRATQVNFSVKNLQKKMRRHNTLTDLDATARASNNWVSPVLL